jgi:regulator of protease activity HflC (stomatin/prohibitin superfamily)
MHRLPPDSRDLLLTLFDRLTDGSVKLRDRLILSGRIVVVTDELFGGVGSDDRLPAMAAEVLQALYRMPEPPRTYGDACRAVLLNHTAVETRRDEEAELAALTRWEGEVETRRIRAAERSEAEQAAAKAERKALRAAKASRTAPARVAA